MNEPTQGVNVQKIERRQRRRMQRGNVHKLFLYDVRIGVIALPPQQYDNFCVDIQSTSVCMFRCVCVCVCADLTLSYDLSSRSAVSRTRACLHADIDVSCWWRCIYIAVILPASCDRSGLTENMRQSLQQFAAANRPAWSHAANQFCVFIVWPRARHLTVITSVLMILSRLERRVLDFRFYLN